MGHGNLHRGDFEVSEEDILWDVQAYNQVVTPADCVKLAKPSRFKKDRTQIWWYQRDFKSGSIRRSLWLYSGTMSAAIEGQFERLSFDWGLVFVIILQRQTFHMPREWIEKLPVKCWIRGIY